MAYNKCFRKEYIILKNLREDKTFFYFPFERKSFSKVILIQKKYENDVYLSSNYKHTIKISYFLFTEKDIYKSFVLLAPFLSAIDNFRIL